MKGIEILYNMWVNKLLRTSSIIMGLPTTSINAIIFQNIKTKYTCTHMYDVCVCEQRDAQNSKICQRKKWHTQCIYKVQSFNDLLRSSWLTIIIYSKNLFQQVGSVANKKIFIFGVSYFYLFLRQSLLHSFNQIPRLREKNWERDQRSSGQSLI